MDVDAWKARLLGKHRLQAVFPDPRHPFKADGEAFGIVLDGRLFLFLEDDNDDYRSALDSILECADDGGWWAFRTDIDRDVLVSFTTQSEYSGDSELFEFRDAETGELGLTIGTDNVSDYYPSFVARYNAAAWGPRDGGS